MKILKTKDPLIIVVVMRDSISFNFIAVDLSIEYSSRLLFTLSQSEYFIETKFNIDYRENSFKNEIILSGKVKNRRTGRYYIYEIVVK